MSDRDTRRVPEDEIDLGRVGRQLGRAAGYPFRLLGRHPFIVLAFIAAGLLLAVATKYILSPQYRATFIIRPSDKQERFHLQMLADLDAIRRQGNYRSLARVLEVDEVTAKALQSIKSENPFLQGRRDSVNYTIITLNASDPTKLIALQNSVKGYLENNPFFSKIAELQKEQVKLQRDMVERDLKLLDTLKARECYRKNSISTPGQFVMSDLVDPTRAFVMANERMAKKTALMAQEVFRENFLLVKPVVVPSLHSFPPRILIAAAYLTPVALVLCFVFLVFYENVRGRRRQQPL